MIPNHRISTHPGVVLLKEFLEPLGLTQKEFAAHIGVPIQRVNEIVRAKRGISPDTAWLFSKAFETSPEFWTSLQSSYELSKNKPTVHISSLKAVAT